MLFNSLPFIFLFLPAVLVGFHALSKSPRSAMVWLVSASLFFYAYWDWRYLPLLLASVAVNFALGRVLTALSERFAAVPVARSILLLGVVANLLCLGYFKYAGFIAENVAAITGQDWHVGRIILPLAISFFTFQQITYLIDCYKGLTKGRDPLSYALFVCFFPQLIAGPIVHYQEMMPQFTRVRDWGLKGGNIAVGLSVFTVGLFKKVVIADGVAAYAAPMFDAAAGGAEPTFVEAWAGVLCYAFQIYFDFSGYSDMAIGLARMFGIRLPENFRSPYKAKSIIEFWRHWHMTLSRFLRDYVYIPLGGNRHGSAARYRNLLLTMVIGGIWHGAGWTFVLWGTLHGVYLLVNHLGQAIAGRREWLRVTVPAPVAIALTFLLVVMAWVPFRAEDIGTAGRIYAGMIGLHGVVLPEGYAGYVGPWRQLLADLGVVFLGDAGTFGGKEQVLYLLGAALVTWRFPNTQALFRRYRPVLRQSGQSIAPGALTWRPDIAWAIAVAGIGVVAITSMTKVAEFLYFQF
ncbi:hypothetical protein CKO28_24195 [Rhodovibrio sodomensis]|uniref:Probable alginate O-acetylase AlgI n=1 Tax=Rhodovibrio sodomensis TaxID=1088 RepID=A0ABS1DKR1_9PROT|nr:MBOAT family protein [Rhodovibrio sodomensis]MBK1671110.1 hypothetical protein [Rhodovibrio sodomensis]